MKKTPDIYRSIANRVMTGTTGLFCLLALAPFFILVWKLFENGWQHFDSGILKEAAPDSIQILLIALLPSVPSGISAGIHIYHIRSGKWGSIFLYLNNLLKGVPSILIGLAVYLCIVRPMHSASALAGGIALAIILFPRMVNATLLALDHLPPHLKESAAALGGTNCSVTLRIILPATGRRLLASILFAITRTLGATTPLIVTAMGANRMDWDFSQPIQTLPLLIWNFFRHPELVNLMWSAALCLFIFITIFHCIAKLIYTNDERPHH